MSRRNAEGRRRSIVRGSILTLAAAATLPAMFPMSAGAASLTWDNNGNTAPNPQDGAGTWDNALLNWFDGVNNVAWNNANNDIAVFGAGGTSGVVTIPGTVQVGGIDFNVAGYTLGAGSNSGIITLNPSAATVVNVNASATLNSQVSGTGSLTINVAAGQTLGLFGSSNNYSGGTTLTGPGTINLGGSSSVNPGSFGTGSVTLNGAILQFGDAKTVGNAITIGAGTTSTLWLAGNGTLSGALTGSGTLLLNATSTGRTWSFNGNNATFSGSVGVGTAGIIRFTSANGGSGSATWDLGTQGTMTARQATATISLGALTGQAGSILQGSSTNDGTLFYQIGSLNVDSTFAGNVTDLPTSSARKAAIVKVGTAKLTLAGTNTYTGATIVNGGTLALGASATLTGTPTLTVNSGATFDVSPIASGYTMPSGQTLSGNGGTILGNLTAGPGATVSPAGLAAAGSLNFGNKLSLSGGSFTMEVDPGANDVINTNQLDLSGGGTFYVAPVATTFSAGTYHLINYTGALTGSLSNVSLLFGARGSGTLQNTTPGVIDLVVTAGGGTADLTWTGASNGTWDISQTQNFVMGATPTAFFPGDTVTFDDTATGTTTITKSGVLQPTSVTITNNTLPYTIGGSGNISGAAALTKNGSGAATLSTSNSYTGGTTINGGTLNLANSSGAGSGSILITDSNAALMLNGGLTVANTINLAADNAIIGGNGSLNGGINTAATNIRFSIPTTGSTVSLNSSTVFTNISAGPIVVTVTDDSTGAVRFVNTNSSFGGVDWNLGNSSVTMFNRDSARNLPLGSLAGGPNTFLRGNSNTTAGVTTYTIGGSSNINSTTFAGTVMDGTVSGNTGTVAIVKAAGSLTLTGNNSYTGTTTVNSGGTLIVNGSHTGGQAYTVAGGGALGGKGVISAAVTSASGATLLPGSPVGELTVGALSVDTNTINYGFNNTGGSEILANGALALANNSTINVNDLGGMLRGTYPLLNYTTLSGTGTVTLGSTTVGPYTLSLVNNAANSSIDLLVTGGAGAVNSQWNVNADGNWSAGANWSPEAPSGVDSIANFGGISTAPHTVTVDAPQTVGRLNFFDNGASYTIAGPSAITLDVSSGAAAINVSTGTHTISAPITLNDDLNVNVTPAGGALTVSGTVSGAKALAKTGAGILTLAGNNSYTGTTTVSGGSLYVNGTHTGGGAYSVASGATIGGSGTVSSAVSVASGGAVSPGSGAGVVGTFSVAALTLDTNRINIDLDAANVDKVVVLNPDALTLANVSTFNFNNLSSLTAGQYPLIDYSGSALADLTHFGLGTTSLAGFNLSLVNNTANTSVDLLVVSQIVTATWNVDADGNWSTAGNWSGGVPNGVDATANLGTIITASRTVTVDSAQTVGTINFSSPNSYSVAGASTLTLDVSSGQAAINVTAGSHTISAPVVLNKDTTITSAAGTGVNLSGNLTATGRTITKAGAGTAQFSNVRATGLNVSEGVARISAKGTPNSAAGTSVVQSLTIANGASLDLTNNSAVIDYTGAVGTLVGDVRTHLSSGRLTTSSGDANHRLGYGDNAVLNKATFAGQTVDTSSVLIKFTYAGDANLDGQVDVTDLGSLATNWQTSNVWTGGDFSYDGFVDVTDLGMLATNWQAGVGSPLGKGSLEAAMAAVGLGNVSVPEPTAFGLIGLGLAAIRLSSSNSAASRRRSRRSR